MTSLVDTNVLLDIVTDDPDWAAWSITAFDLAALRGPVIINDIVYAELAARYLRVEDLDAFVDGIGLQWVAIPRSALFLAAKAYMHYRRSGGVRTGVLSDFFIGAHAAVLNVPLLTRDKGHFRTYFPDLELISPG